jgi:hypothetical protein
MSNEPIRTRNSKRDFVRQIAVENRDSEWGARILWSRHATARLIDYGLSRVDIEEALTQCVVVEDYPSVHRALPDCLVLGYLPSGEPLHAVVALDVANNRVFVITVYIPSAERWQNEWQTRK